jgi:hypothetical protein
VIHWVQADKKDSWLFLEMLHKLTEVYAQATVIHVILVRVSQISARLARVPAVDFDSAMRMEKLRVGWKLPCGGYLSQCG